MQTASTLWRPLRMTPMYGFSSNQRGVVGLMSSLARRRQHARASEARGVRARARPGVLGAMGQRPHAHIAIPRFEPVISVWTSAQAKVATYAQTGTHSLWPQCYIVGARRGLIVGGHARRERQRRPRSRC